MANTPNYDLPLLDTSNIPSWLVGWNQAMNTIDIALEGLQEQIDGATGEPITVDSEFSETSENPVQNKVITAYLNQLTARVAALEKGSEIKITTQPVNVSAYKGQSFSFSITAESNLPLTYKWYFKGSSDTEFTETNTTTNTYTATATSDRIGAMFEYKCKVSNGLSEVWSEIGVLTIVEKPEPSYTITITPNRGQDEVLITNISFQPIPTLPISISIWGQVSATADWKLIKTQQITQNNETITTYTGCINHYVTCVINGKTYTSNTI